MKRTFSSNTQSPRSLRNASSFRKAFLLLASILLLSLLTPISGNAQDKAGKQKLNGSEYRFDQLVMVRLKDGTEVPARITSVLSKKQYLVLEVGGSRRGSVNRRDIRRMTPQEMENWKKPTGTIARNEQNGS